MKVFLHCVCLDTFHNKKLFDKEILIQCTTKKKSQCNLLGGKTSRQYMAKAALWGSWDGNTWI